MSTNGLTSWAVDLKDVGAIYPFQGWETTMVVLGLIFWIGWHIIQIRGENAEMREKMRHLDAEKVRSAIDRY